MVLSKIQVSDPEPSWPSCYYMMGDLHLSEVILDATLLVISISSFAHNVFFSMKENFTIWI